jgi:hypothetical protein
MPPRLPRPPKPPLPKRLPEEKIPLPTPAPAPTPTLPPPVPTPAPLVPTPTAIPAPAPPVVVNDLADLKLLRNAGIAAVFEPPPTPSETAAPPSVSPIVAMVEAEERIGRGRRMSGLPWQDSLMRWPRVPASGRRLIRLSQANSMYRRPRLGRLPKHSGLRSPLPQRLGSPRPRIRSLPHLGALVPPSEIR